MNEWTRVYSPLCSSLEEFIMGTLQDHLKRHIPVSHKLRPTPEIHGFQGLIRLQLGITDIRYMLVFLNHQLCPLVKELILVSVKLTCRSLSFWILTFDQPWTSAGKRSGLEESWLILQSYVALSLRQGEWNLISVNDFTWKWVDATQKLINYPQRWSVREYNKNTS